MNPLNHSKREIGEILLAMVLLSVALILTAHAGTNTDFGAVESKLVSWLNGSMGRMFALGSIGIGLAMAMTKQHLMFIVVSVGIGLTALVAPNILQTIVSATL